LARQSVVRIPGRTQCRWQAVPACEEVVKLHTEASGVIGIRIGHHAKSSVRT
jgi:hypothetical protein